MEESGARRATLFEALIPIFFLIIALGVTIIYLGEDPHIPLVFSALVAALVALRVGHQWKEVEQGIFDGIMLAMQAIIILMIIGMLIGTWTQGGVVPTLIYYGLQVLSPQIFLVATVIICAVVSISTGSSWTTAGTLGIAALGIGEGLGIPTAMIAGAIISGAYMGDKLSPLSDTTNLAPAMAGETDLFDHIRHMLWVTVPGIVITLIIFAVIGMQFGGEQLEAGRINEIITTMSDHFFISPLLLIAPALVILMVVFKIPPIPGLMAGSILGAIFAMVFQGADLASVVGVMHYGFSIDSGVEMVDELLTGGGLNGMMWTISLILAALSFGGIMEKSGFLEVIVDHIISIAKSAGNLALSTHIVCVFINLVSGDQYLALVIPGRMYQDAFKKKNLHPKNLSRIVESSGTITSPLVPWNTCGAFMATTLGVHPFVYLPFAFFNLITPLISILYGYINFSIAKYDPDQPSAYEVEADTDTKE